MIVYCLDAQRLADLRSGSRSSRRGLYVPLNVGRALAAGALEPDDQAPLGYRLSGRYDLAGVDLMSEGEAGGAVLRFDAARWDMESAALVAVHLGGGMLVATPELAGTPATPEELAAETAAAEVETLAVEEPTREDLGIIRRRHALDPAVRAEELVVFERWVCNDALARSGFLQLDTTAVEKAAADFDRGRSVLLYHNGSRIVGRTFAGTVERRSREGLSASWARVRGYAHRRASNQDMIDDLRLGILAYDSIGFMGGDVSLVEEAVPSPGQKTKVKRSFIRIAHDPDSPTPFVAAETSFVYLGQLHGAGNERLAASKTEADGKRKGSDDPASDTGDGKTGDRQVRSVVFL